MITNIEMEPVEGKRISVTGLKDRQQYVIIDPCSVMVTFPDNTFDLENKNYQSTATALTRVMSVALQAGVSMDIIKKQLRESSQQKGDTPDVLNRAIEKYEEIEKTKN